MKKSLLFCIIASTLLFSSCSLFKKTVKESEVFPLGASGRQVLTPMVWNYIRDTFQLKDDIQLYIAGPDIPCEARTSFFAGKAQNGKLIWQTIDSTHTIRVTPATLGKFSSEDQNVLYVQFENDSANIIIPFRLRGGTNRYFGEAVQLNEGRYVVYSNNVEFTVPKSIISNYLVYEFGRDSTAGVVTRDAHGVPIESTGGGNINSNSNPVPFLQNSQPKPQVQKQQKPAATHAPPAADEPDIK